jgi:hypothetical protein
MTPMEINDFLRALSQEDKNHPGWRVPTGPAGRG